MQQIAIRQKINPSIWKKSLAEIFWWYKEWEIIFLKKEDNVFMDFIDLEDLTENQKILYKNLENTSKEQFYNI